MNMLFFLIHKENLLLLINNMGMFWKSNLGECEPQMENEKIFLFVKLCVRSYIAFMLIICFFYFMNPLFLAEVIQLGGLVVPYFSTINFALCLKSSRLLY